MLKSGLRAFLSLRLHLNISDKELTHLQVVPGKKLVKHLQKEVARLEAELRSPEPSSFACLRTLLMEKDLKIQQVNFNSLDVKYVLVVFGCLVGYPSDDINKFLWMVRIGGGVFPHIKEPDYLVSCCLLFFMRHVFTTHHWMVRIYKLKPPKNRIRVKIKKSKSKASSTTSSKKEVEKKRRIPGNERHFQKMLSPISYL
ncbi:unnamed protein product, partial [Vitis vinifera]|uniref:Uncharacterized protein n=1 Tax=Vitis vinifera TaxID=29760 RepID=D7T3Q6_VITVI